MDFADVAKAALSRLARRYAHMPSAGGSATRLQLHAWLNVGRDGKRFFDGLMDDDPAAGTYPVVRKDGGMCPDPAADRRPSCRSSTSRTRWQNIWPPQHPDWLSSSYLENKRNNARILRDKGLTNYRMYEVRSISHSGGETYADGKKGDLEILDLSRLYDRFFDMLDAWVDKGVAPPPTHSDAAELGDANHDGVIENPALAFPEVACPLGVYYGYPETTSQRHRVRPTPARGSNRSTRRTSGST